MVDGFKVVIHSGVGVCTLLQNRQEDSKMGHFIFHTQIIQLVTFEKSSTDLGDRNCKSCYNHIPLKTPHEAFSFVIHEYLCLHDASWMIIIVSLL